jgi:hypothetical protein
MGGLARRLLAAVTAVMPSGRRDWGRAMVAELDYAHSRRDQARLVLGAVRVALLPPPGLAGYGRAVGRASLIAAVACVPLATVLYLSNVVFPSPEDSTSGVLAGDLYLIVTLMAAGAAAGRAAPRPGGPLVAGMAAGLIIALLSMGTFAVIDNAFLAVVMHQQGKIDGFRSSGMHSMRAYINASLEAAAPGVAVILALAGAFLGSLGAIADRDIGLAWQGHRVRDRGFRARHRR